MESFHIQCGFSFFVSSNFAFKKLFQPPSSSSCLTRKSGFFLPCSVRKYPSLLTQPTHVRATNDPYFEDVLQNITHRQQHLSQSNFQPQAEFPSEVQSEVQSELLSEVQSELESELQSQLPSMARPRSTLAPLTFENSILGQIGNTPLVEATHMLPKSKKGVRLFLKLEGNNPGGSVKDRPAFYMIHQAYLRGELGTGQETDTTTPTPTFTSTSTLTSTSIDPPTPPPTPPPTLVEPTSGNTGIALAFIAGLLHLPMVLIMPENSTEERIKTMRAYGAQVVLTPASQGMEGARDLAHKWQREKGYILLDQFQNDDNWRAHYHTTGPEIWKDTHEQVTHFVSSMGTTGTITGVSTYLKEKNPNITIVGVQPAEGAKIPGIRKWSPEYMPKFFDPKNVDITMDVTEEQAKDTAIKLAKDEGVFAGMSSGGAVYCALQLAQQIQQGLIVVIICDRGDRYLSSTLFE